MCSYISLQYYWDFWTTVSQLLFSAWNPQYPGHNIENVMCPGHHCYHQQRYWPAAFLSAATLHLQMPAPRWKFLCASQELSVITAQLWCADLLSFVKLMKWLNTQNEEPMAWNSLLWVHIWTLVGLLPSPSSSQGFFISLSLWGYASFIVHVEPDRGMLHSKWDFSTLTLASAQQQSV